MFLQLVLMEDGVHNVRNRASVPMALVAILWTVVAVACPVLGVRVVQMSAHVRMVFVIRSQAPVLVRLGLLAFVAIERVLTELLVLNVLAVVRVRRIKRQLVDTRTACAYVGLDTMAFCATHPVQ